jgi:hypothetical protein
MAKPTYQLHPLSESVNFLPINISATSSGTATLLHEVDGTNYDEVWLDAYNYGNTDAIITLCLGGTAAHQLVPIPVPAGRGIIPILRGSSFNGGIDISAYASITNMIAVLGRINRIIFI